MPTKKIDGKSIGIIAGSGELPNILYNHCKQNNINCKIAALNSFSEPSTFKDNRDTKFFRIAQVGGIINFFSKNGIKDIVMIGKVTRPNLLTTFPDLLGLKLIRKFLKVYRKGDSSLFKEISEFIEEQGLNLVGIHEIFPELLAEIGSISNIKPTAKQKEDIKFGFKQAKEIGKKDIGQAIIVKNGEVLATEDVNGTNYMIEAFSEDNGKDSGAILIKVAKPKQNKKIDLPTIGTDTVKLCNDNGLAGIAIEAKSSLLANKIATQETADKLGVFIVGV